MKTWLLSGLMVLMSTVAFAATEVVDGIEWTYQVSNGEAKIYGHYDSYNYTYIPAIPSSTSGTITIPSILGGCPVTSIGDSAFWCCSSLTSVTIPEGVTEIGWYAFNGCSSLPKDENGVQYESAAKVILIEVPTSMTGEFVIPNTVRFIHSYAFYDCSGLTSVTIPEGVTSIGDYAFAYCSGLTSVTIPEGVTSIGDYAFRGCSSLTSVTIPSSLTSIGEWAFSGCSSLNSFVVDSANQHYTVMNKLLCSKDGKMLVACPGGLTSVTIPSSVTSIGDYAFSGCVSLTSVTIPSSVTSIGFATFWGCSSLTSVTIPSSVTSIGRSAFSDCSSLTSVTIPESVTSIGDDAFSGCTSLTSVTIPSSVTSIGNYAFSGCTSLTSVTIPSSVTSIGNYAFRNCSSLTSVTIPEGVISIGDYAFDGCTGLTSVTIPEGVTSIGDYAFDGCTGLTSVTIPEGVTSIGSSAFEGCTGLTSVTIPEGVTSIGSYAFKECSSLTSVTIPSSVTSIGKSAFFSCYDLTSVHISDIAAWCRISFSNDTANPFYYAKYLYLNGELVADLVIPSSVTSIGDYAFDSCSGLTSVTIPSSVTSIGDDAFSGCTSLTSVTIPSSVTSIGNYAFRNCSSLTSVTIPSSVTSIGSSAFSGCSGLPKDENGVQYESVAKVILIDVPTSMTGEFVIPNTVRFIHSSAFRDCSSLTSVTIPEGVTSIGSSAFRDCSSLTSVTIPEGVTSIGSSAFFDCYRLTFMTIPSSVTEIGDWAFADCYRLTSVTIPSSVTEIGEYAFFDCNRLTSVTILEGLTSIGSSAFAGCSSLTSVSIPEGVTSIGSSAFAGCSNLTSVTIPSSVTEIGDHAFYNCESLTSVTIPEGVTEIGSSAFAGCSSLTSVTIPSSMTSIGNYAFSNCSGLTSVTIPEGVTEIGGGAFQYCDSLTSVLFKGNPPNASSSSFPSCDGYYPSTKATEWSKVIKSGFWNNLRMISYQLVTLSFNANGGTGGGSDEYIVGMSLQPPTVSREGYTFKGWSPSVPSVVPETTTTYTAQWQVNQYRMTFNANGGTGGQTLTLDYGSRLTAPTVSRDGCYTFVGWLPEVPKTVPAENVTYTAQWQMATVDIKQLDVTVNEKKRQVTITGCYPPIEGCLEIPTEINGATVVAIADGAFKGQQGLMKVTLPDTITSIGKDAFKDCQNLDVNAIVMPNQPKLKVGKGAFTGCMVTEVPAVPGEPLTSAQLGTAEGYKAATTASGLKLNAKTGDITATFKKPGMYEAVFFKPGELLKVIRVTVGEMPTLTINPEGVNARGSVKGDGAYLMGKKVALKATASKGYVFAGWYQDEAFTIPCDSTLVDYRDPSYSYTMGKVDVTFYARFIPAIADDVLTLAVQNKANDTIAESFAIKGSAEFALLVDSKSLPKVSVKGLPVGMKFTAKPVMKKGSKTEVEYPANCIYGAPTKPGVYTVTVSLTNATVKKAVTKTFNIEVPNLKAPGVIDVYDRYGEYVPGVSYIEEVPEAEGCTVTGLPAGMKWTAKALYKKGSKTEIEIPANSVYGAPTKPGNYTVYFTKTVDKVKHTATATFKVGPYPQLNVMVSDGGVGGKVAGIGAYAANKKVTLKATASKGYVFAGWYKDGVPCDSTSVDYRNPSYTYVMGENDAQFYARFVTKDEEADYKMGIELIDEDYYSLGDDVQVCAGEEMGPVKVWVDSLTLPTAKVTGLPTGLKFDAKTFTISGKPTKPGFYPITIEAKNASKSRSTFAIVNLEVRHFNAHGLHGDWEDAEPIVIDAFTTEPFDLEDWFGGFFEDLPIKSLKLPAGLTYNAKTGTINGNGKLKSGSYTVTLTDKAGKVTTFTIMAELDEADMFCCTNSLDGEYYNEGAVQGAPVSLVWCFVDSANGDLLSAENAKAISVKFAGLPSGLKAVVGEKYGSNCCVSLNGKANVAPGSYSITATITNSRTGQVEIINSILHVYPPPSQKNVYSYFANGGYYDIDKDKEYNATRVVTFSINGASASANYKITIDTEKPIVQSGKASLVNLIAHPQDDGSVDYSYYFYSGTNSREVGIAFYISAESSGLGYFNYWDSMLDGELWGLDGYGF